MFINSKKFVIFKSLKGLNQVKYIENLFLADFPYMLAENFEYTAEARKNSHHVYFILLDLNL